MRRAQELWPLARMDAGQRQAIRRAMWRAGRKAGKPGHRHPSRLLPETRQTRGPASGPCGTAKRRRRSQEQSDSIRDAWIGEHSFEAANKRTAARDASTAQGDA